MQKLINPLLALFLLFSCSPVFAEKEAASLRFDFQESLGEGTFNLYRLNINIETRLGRFCFVDSEEIRQVPDDLPGIVYRGEPWADHFDFEREHNKACFDVQLAFANDAFSSPKPFEYGGYEYQFFFDGKIRSAALDVKGKYYIDGNLTYFSRQVQPRGRDIYIAHVTVNNVLSH